MDPIKTTAVTDAEGNFDVTVTVSGGPGIKKIGVQAGETGAPAAVTSAQSVPAPGATTTGGPTTTAGPGSTTTTTTTPAPTTTPSPLTTNITFRTTRVRLQVRYKNAAGATAEAFYYETDPGGTVVARAGTGMTIINNGLSGNIIIDGVGTITPRGGSTSVTVPSTATTYNCHL
jgi:hypothetical protein